MPNWRYLTKGYITRYETGPQEFLGLINEAEYICTNSFHATVFSIIYKKKFFVGSGSGKKDSRLETLLDRFNLKDRLLLQNNFEDINLNNPNFETSENILSEERNRSIAFLRRSLNI